MPATTKAWSASWTMPAGLTRARRVPYTEKYRKNDDVYPGNDCSRSGVPLPDYCGFTAKREGGGPRGRLWRHGLPDGVRPPRLCDPVIEGDDDLRGPVHVDLADAF